MAARENLLTLFDEIRKKVSEGVEEYEIEFIDC